MLKSDRLSQSLASLNNHPLLIGNHIRSINDVRVLMQYHVYAVWDFMCLIKTLQHTIVPSTTIWTPQPYPAIGRFVNEVVLGEETDIDPTGRVLSHYDLYILGMKEVGADTAAVENFISGLNSMGWHTLPQLLSNIPPPAERFCRTTLDTIGTQSAHVIAASFTYGRETVIPAMFTGVLDQLNRNNLPAPMFRYYLQRHIDIDGEEHGPIALQMVEQLCENDPHKLAEAESAACSAIDSRITFWNDVLTAIEASR